MSHDITVPLYRAAHGRTGDDARQHPAVVSIEDAKGAIIDGLLQKDGKLTPVDFSELRGITKEADPGAPGNAPSSHP